LVLPRGGGEFSFTLSSLHPRNSVRRFLALNLGNLTSTLERVESLEERTALDLIKESMKASRLGTRDVPSDSTKASTNRGLEPRVR
jgi:hypothetical protein